uniref:Reverse transcriptase domain-containing protein n=1 Tax=Trichogramma kaykai TaxID=54128 RepID=A0ABD2VY53_9HYME
MQALGREHVSDETLMLLWVRLLPSELAVLLNKSVIKVNAPQVVAKADRLHERLKSSKSYSQIFSLDSAQDSESDVTVKITNAVLAAISAQTKSDQRPSHPKTKERYNKSKSSNRCRLLLHPTLCMGGQICTPRQRPGKLEYPDVCEASAPGSLISDSKRLFIKDLCSGSVYLIDTGVEISVCPRGDADDSALTCMILHAANGTAIKTYGSCNINLNFGLRRKMNWSFIRADVPYSIFGADALVHFDLVPHLKCNRLIDNLTGLFAQGHLAPVTVHGISLVDPSHPLAHILRKHSQIFNSQATPSARATKMLHYLPTTDDPIAQRARRLTPEKLKAVRQQFAKWREEGICRPSDSPWSSPIHIVPKKTPGDFRICGDYRKLNAVTKPNRYPVPNLHDFTSILDGSKIFSTLDLYQAFHQIPMAPEDVPKTALITPIGLFEFLFMPFGLRNASQTFQQYVNKALWDLPFRF